MLKTWFIAARPWAFTAAIIPILLGTALAYLEGCFEPFLFILTLCAAILIQAGTNYINTWGDYVSGVDSIQSAVTCPQLVTGTLSTASMKQAGIFCLTVSAIIGLWLSYSCGWPVLVCGLLGILGGYCYTAGPLPYKYHGFGSLFVFFLMGPLMVGPAYYIQTKALNAVPIIASLPVAFLVSAILQANDLRDIADDRNANIKTPAIFFGKKLAMKLYVGSIIAAFLSLLIIICSKYLPLTAGLPLLILPSLIKNYITFKKASAGSRHKMEQLVKQTAMFHCQFGLLLVLGIMLYPCIGI